MSRALAALILCGCATSARTPAVPVPASSSAPQVPAATAAPIAASAALSQGQGQGAASLFIDRKAGWDAVDSSNLPDIEALTRDYQGFIGTAKTARRAVAGLRALAGDKATELAPGQRPARTPGARFVLTGMGGGAAAFVLLGKRPVEQGVRMIIAAVDAPHIELKQRPVYSKAGFAMLDTMLYGNLDLPSWLVHPLALYLHVARPGAAGGGLDIIVGEGLDQPVLAIPDLLPHLSRKIQRDTIVDSPERMDAIAARSEQALAEFLAAQGVDSGVLAEAEAALVPAGAPVLIGVDRALIAGYGHHQRALAYAAVRALLAADTPEHTAVVIVVSSAGDRGVGVDFARAALSRILAALSARGEAIDSLDVRQFYARSAGLAGAHLTGKQSHGVVLAPGSDDSPPETLRRVVDVFERAGAQYQISSKAGWGPSRGLSELDLAMTDIALPVTGTGTPFELLSALDLYQALLACKGWLTQS